MSFVFDTGKHGSINDNAVRDLPIGKHNYEILEVKVVGVKADKTGKRKQISIGLKCQDGKNYTTFLELQPKPLIKGASQEQKDGEEMRARIAAETFNALVLACGIKKGTQVTLPMLVKFKGKVVGIETAGSVVGKGTAAKTYVNIRMIDEPFDLDDTGAEDEEDDSDDTTEDQEYESEEESEEEEPTPRPKKKLATKGAKPAPKKKVVDVEEEDEEEEEEEEEEGEDEPW